MSLLVLATGAFVTFIPACLTPPAAVTSANPPTQTAHGVLIAVDAASLQQLNTFTLRTDDGQELTFKPASNFNQGVEHVMTPGHMRQHMALAEPVTVTYQDQNGTLIALSATD